MDNRKFILERFHMEWKMNIFCFNQVGELVATYGKENPAWMIPNENLQRDEMSESLVNIFDKIYAGCREKKVPLFLEIENGIYSMAFSDEEGYVYIIGPAATTDITFAQILDFRKKHYVTNQKFQIPTISIAKAMNGLILLYYMLTERAVTEEMILAENECLQEHASNVHLDEKDFMTYEIQQTTEEKHRLAYKDELKWLAEIENGTRKETSKMMVAENLEKLDQIGTFSNKSALKQFEYMVIASTTLACRATIRGGVNAHEAYNLADVFFQKTSMCTDIMQLLQLYAEIADEYARRVRMVKESTSSDLVEQCKEYIARNRMQKFSLSQLANEIGKNPSYISRMFSEQTHKTLQEYALEQRLEAGANLLKYSDRSVGDIAEYLHFPSQSYFGDRFKKIYGQSPADYRKKNRVHDFDK